MAKLLKSGGNVLLLDEPTNDLDVETLRALEDALEDFAGCAVIISHDRFFLDRICTHILAFEGEAHVEWFEGNFEDYEEDKKRRLGPDALEPKRMKYKKFPLPGRQPRSATLTPPRRNLAGGHQTRRHGYGHWHREMVQRNQRLRLHRARERRQGCFRPHLGC
jgi:ABC-type multidrug transport system ATPase subunit